MSKPIATSDLCDAHPESLADGSIVVLQPGLTALGRHASFHGPAVTLKLFEDNSLLADMVKTPGRGRVLVVDGGGSLRCALLGGNLAAAAAKNQWAGVVVYGAVRDAGEIDGCEIGVLALGLDPRRSVKRGVGEVDAAVSFLGATIRPGDWMYADRDGVLVCRRQLDAMG